MKNRRALISVVIATYNRPSLLVRSVRSVLGQTYRNFEIIVIDDCSDRETYDTIQQNFSSILNSNTLRYFRNHTNLERSASRNLAMDHAKGDYIAFLDDDDVWMPNHLSVLLDVFEHSSSFVKCVFANYFILSSQNLGACRVRFSDEITYIHRNLRQGYNLCFAGILVATPTVMIKKEVYTRLGGFDTAINVYEDREFFTRIAIEEQIAFSPEPTVCVYERQANLSNKDPDQEKYVIEKCIAHAIIKNRTLNKRIIGESFIKLAWDYLPDIPRVRFCVIEAFKSDFHPLFSFDGAKLILRVVMGQKLYLYFKNAKKAFSK